MINFDSMFQPRQKWRRRTHPLTSYAKHRLGQEKRKLSHGLFPTHKDSTLSDYMTSRVSREILTQDFFNPLRDGLLKRSPLSFLNSFKLPFF